MRFTPTILTSLLAISTLAGCGLNSAFDMGNASPRSQNQLCNQLKRDIMFYSMDQNHDTAWSSPAKQANILRQYQENNCEAILSGKADGRASTAESTPFSIPGEHAPRRDRIQVRTQS